MELRHLRYFAALAEELNFTRAAERVHVAQSTLSHQIRQIEDEIGQRLFDRVGKHVLITEAGEAFLLYATRALREVDEGLRAVRKPADPVTGTLRIAATHTFMMRLVPECLAALFQRHPRLAVTAQEMVAADIVHAVKAGSVDVGVAFAPHRQPQLAFEPLYVEEMVLAVAAGHPFAERRRVRLAELHKQPLILATRESSTRRIIDLALKSVAAEPVIVAEMNPITTTIELVRRTRLAAIISRFAAPDARDIRIIALENPRILRAPGLLTRVDRPATTALRTFIGIVRRAVLEQRQVGSS